MKIGANALAVSCILCCAVGRAAAETPMTCRDYVEGVNAAHAAGKLEEFVRRPTIAQLHILATGASLAMSRTLYSDASDAQKADPSAMLYETCAINLDARAADIAISMTWKDRQPAAARASKATEPAPKPNGPTITAKEIAAGVSASKTEIEQEQWWKENMAGKFHTVVGKVSDVKEGTFSGYWVDLDIGRNVLVRCGLSRAWAAAAAKIKKGNSFTCHGTVAKSWTAIFGIAFSMDAG